MAMGQVMLKEFLVDRKVPTARASSRGRRTHGLGDGRMPEHYDAGTTTRRTANLALLPTEHLDLHPADAARLECATVPRSS